MAEQVAVQQFVLERDGRTVVVLAGARFPSSSAVVKAHPTMFAPPKAKAPRKAK
jgi:hypothetical protein